MQIVRFLTVALVVLVLVAPNAHAASVEYEVIFDATWSRLTHPQDFPPNPHWSGLIGGVHNADMTFWELEGIATRGIERLAELGSKSPLTSEVATAVDAGDALAVISGGGIGSSSGSVFTTFEMNSPHRRVTLVSMIAPSPDWFVGVSGLRLFVDGEWIDELVVPLHPHDAGTDSGSGYRSSNDNTNPKEPISLLSNVTPFTGTPSLGTFTFRLVPEPSLLIGGCVIATMLMLRRRAPGG